MLNTVQVLKDLIRFNTSNPPGNEMPALLYLAVMLRQFGAQTVLTPLADGSRGHLIARLPGTNPALPALVLLSHIDVVPANASQWLHPPFEAVEEDGYIYGRGAVDTKQLTAMELEAFFTLSRAGAPSRDVYMVVTGDEECGSDLGLKHLTRQTLRFDDTEIRVSELLRGSLVISEGGGFPIRAGEQLLYLVETGQKGCGQVSFTFCAPGNAYLAGTGALKRAARLVEDLHRTALQEYAGPTFKQFETALCQAYTCGTEALPQKLPPMMRSILYAMRHNTLTPTLIQGAGLREVTVTCDVRLLPGFGRADLERIVLPLAEKWGARAEIVSFSAGYESSADETVRLLEDCLNRELPCQTEHVPLLPFLSMGSSDGRFLQPYKANVYGFSPVLASDMTFDQAVRMVHGVEERIHRDSLDFGCRVLTRAVRHLCGAAEREGV